MGHREFRFGDWQVDVEGNTLSDGATRVPLEPRAMEVLRYLCRHPGAVIPAEELLQACWGSAEFGDNPVHKAITQLRRALGDSSTEPRYIETIRKRGYRAIAEVIEAEEDGQVVWTSGSPFRGLEPFQENHSAIFFGRVQATARLKELVEKQTLGGHAMALVLGPSGSGKTSLVRAGLMPQLMQPDANENNPISLNCILYLDCADLGEGSLFHALGAVLLDAEFNSHSFFPGESAASLGKKLEHGDPKEIFGFLSKRKKPVVGLFIDRLEAIFRAKDIHDEARKHFVDLLEVLATEKGVLILMACRNDFYPEIIALSKLTALKASGGHFDLTAPDGADIAQIIRLPAKAAQLSYETDPTSGASLDDVLCDAARGSPDTLPLLQYCLNELYRQRSESGELRFEVFKQLGGIEGAIGIRAEQIITALTSEQASALPQILSLLVNIGDEQSAVTARSVAWSMLRNEDERDLVRAMVEARLFVSELAGEVPSFCVAHEALLRRWPRVAGWIEQHRSSLQLRTRLNGQAERWIVAGRPRDLLLPGGSQVAQALALAELPGFNLGEAENEFIYDSAKRAKWLAGIRFLVLGIVVTLSIVAGILGIVARTAQAKAEQHRTEAEGLMGYMLGEFVEKLRPLGRLDLLDDVSNKSLGYLSSVKIDDDSPVALNQRAKALQVIAEVSIDRSNPEKATQALLSAKKILNSQYQKGNKTKSLLKDIGINSFWLGQLSFNKADWKNAEIYFSQYLHFSNQLVLLDPYDSDGLIEQSYAYSALSGVATKLGDTLLAAQTSEKSIDLKEKVLQKQPNNKKLQADLANSYSWLGDAKIKLGKLKEAMLIFKEEEGLLQPLHLETPSNSSWAYRLANSLGHQGDLAIALGNIENAKESFSSSEKILREITLKDPSNHSWQIAFYNVKLRLLELEDTPQKKEKTLLEQKSIYNSLLELSRLDSKRAKIMQISLRAQQNLAQTEIFLKKFTEAFDIISQNVRLSEKLHLENRSEPIWISTYANALLIQAEILSKQGKAEEANRSCHTAQLLLDSSKNSLDYKLLAPYVRAHLCLGNIRSAQTYQEKLKAMEYSDLRHNKYVSTTQVER